MSGGAPAGSTHQPHPHSKLLHSRDRTRRGAPSQRGKPLEAPPWALLRWGGQAVHGCELIVCPGQNLASPATVRTPAAAQQGARAGRAIWLRPKRRGSRAGHGARARYLLIAPSPQQRRLTLRAGRARTQRWRFRRPCALVCVGGVRPRRQLVGLRPSAEEGPIGLPFVTVGSAQSTLRGQPAGRTRARGGAIAGGH